MKITESMKQATIAHHLKMAKIFEKVGRLSDAAAAKKAAELIRHSK